MTTLDDIKVETLPAEPKPAVKSLTWVSALVTVVFSALGAAGVAYTADDVHNWTEIAERAAPYAAIAVSGVISMVGRWRATAPIKNGPADPEVMAEKVQAKVRREILRKS
jgi:hypothetical protein